MSQHQLMITAPVAFSPLFPKFVELPSELRLMIWELACIPRVVVLDFTLDIMSSVDQRYRLHLVFGASSFSTSQQIPISAICMESRQVFKKAYTRIDGWEDTEPTDSTIPDERTQPIYMNFGLDTLQLPGMAIDHHFDIKFNTKILQPRLCDGLRYLAIWWGSFLQLFFDVKTPPTEPKSWIYRVVNKFPRLKELVIAANWLPRKERGNQNIIPPYEFTDCKYVAYPKEEDIGVGDVNPWEILMGEILEWNDAVKDNYPAFASLKVDVVGVEQSTGPGDYEPDYIKMGPAEETNRQKQRLEAT